MNPHVRVGLKGDLGRLAKLLFQASEECYRLSACLDAGHDLMPDGEEILDALPRFASQAREMVQYLTGIDEKEG